MNLQNLPSSIYLEGQGDIVSRLITRITRVTLWVIRAMNLLTRPPDPPSRGYEVDYDMGHPMNPEAPKKQIEENIKLLNTEV